MNLDSQKERWVVRECRRPQKQKRNQDSKEEVQIMGKEI